MMAGLIFERCPLIPHASGFRYAVAIMNSSDLLAQLRAKREAAEREAAECEVVEQVVERLREIAGDELSQPADTRSAGDHELYQQILEEYKFLRVELEAIWGQTYSTLNFMLAAIGLMIAAAYGQYGDPLILLLMTAIVTIGGYKLIRIHTTRVWRIVGYMRLALEPQLPGIKWETRLAARHWILIEKIEKSFDRDIFDGHILILDTVNWALLLGIIASGLFGHSEKDLVSKLIQSFGILGRWVTVIPALVPAVIIVWSLRTRHR
jgi:hypothetical protein